MNSLGSRVVATVVIGAAWLVFLVLFLAFFAQNFHWYQNLAIVLASFVVSGALTIVMWVRWALRE